MTTPVVVDGAYHAFPTALSLVVGNTFLKYHNQRAIKISYPEILRMSRLLVPESMRTWSKIGNQTCQGNLLSRGLEIQGPR